MPTYGVVTVIVCAKTAVATETRTPPRANPFISCVVPVWVVIYDCGIESVSMDSIEQWRQEPKIKGRPSKLLI